MVLIVLVAKIKSISGEAEWCKCNNSGFITLVSSFSLYDWKPLVETFK